MASITKRGGKQWQAEVRKKGHTRQTRTFLTKAAAERWANSLETTIAENKFRDQRAIAKITLQDALARYLDEIVPTKAKGGQTQERNRCNQLMRHRLASNRIAQLLPYHFAEYRNERLKVVSANSVRLELALLSHLYTIAIREWSWPLTHALRDVARPAAPEGRERRLLSGEEERLYQSIRSGNAKHPQMLEAYIRLALETTMRACETLTTEWSQVDLEVGVIRLTKAKNGSKRLVGLSLEAVRILKSLPRSGALLFPVYPNSTELDRDFRLARKAAHIENLRAHDLRHEATSRLASQIQTIELCKQAGWKSLKTPLRYFNDQAEEAVERIRRAEAARLAKAAAPAPEPPLSHPAPPAPPTIRSQGNVLHVTFGKPRTRASSKDTHTP